MSEAHKGRVPWNKGVSCYSSTKIKIGLANKGRTHTNETKRKISGRLLGRKFSAETRNKMSVTWKKKLESEEERRKISIRRTGHSQGPFSLEARKHMSDSHANSVYPIKDTSIEVEVQKYLSNHNIIYEKHSIIKGLLPHPYHNHQFDIMIKERKLVIEINGCYWHGCTFHHPTPNEKQKKWMERDRIINSCISKSEWQIIWLWEHDINSDMTMEYLLKREIPELFTGGF
jgi:DNA mismatch endonuclease (patch repair protein)